MTDKEIIFEKYCEINAIADTPYSVPAILRAPTWIVAKDFDKKPSLYKARKCVKELTSEGLLMKDCFGGNYEDGGVWCTHGYIITEKALETDTYKRINKEVEKFFDEMCNRDEQNTKVLGW